MSQKGTNSAANTPIQITYGHDNTHVIVQFTQMINNNRMTEKQTRDMIGALENTLQKLAEHQQRAAPASKKKQ